MTKPAYPLPSAISASECGYHQTETAKSKKEIIRLKEKKGKKNKYKKSPIPAT
jgi:hypothetical protein